jgi:hypothetical protein
MRAEEDPDVNAGSKLLPERVGIAVEDMAV